VRKALNSAAEELRTDDLDIEVDSDTGGEPGSPVIGEVILRKIRQADVVVCDVTPVAVRKRDLDGDEGATVPNPNVLFEAGYAIATVELGSVILQGRHHLAKRD